MTDTVKSMEGQTVNPDAAEPQAALLVRLICCTVIRTRLAPIMANESYSYFASGGLNVILTGFIIVSGGRDDPCPK